MNTLLAAQELGAPETMGMSADEFAWVVRFLRQHTGIELKEGKQSLVTSRLDRRLRHYGLRRYTEYFELLATGGMPSERQVAIDLLTTNETSFFREPEHFDLLPGLLPRPGATSGPVRVWSAACSSGEEVWTIAMVLASRLGSRPWEVLGTDISGRVLDRAREGVYPMESTSRIPTDLLHRYCLRGKGPQEGTFAIGPVLRPRARFAQANLCASLPQIGTFDVVFLRNVMIYFDKQVKRQVLARVVRVLRPGGVLIVGHAEPMNDRGAGLVQLRPSVFRLEGDGR